MRAIDTNVLVRLFTGDEERQAKIAEDFIENGAWVSVLALAEAIWVLANVYERTPTDLLHIMERAIQNNHLSFQDEDAVAAALDLFRAHPSLGFSDCLMLEIARKAGHLPLGTFDRRLARIPGATRL